jgi:hypothetical protein
MVTNAPEITLDWVEQEEKRLRAALDDLAATKRVILMRAAQLRDAATDNPRPLPPRPWNNGGAAGAGLTNKQVFLRVIADESAGRTTQEVILAATLAGLENRNTGNVSPHLSSYRAEGLLDLNNGVWTITDKGREYLAPKKD